MNIILGKTQPLNETKWRNWFAWRPVKINEFNRLPGPTYWVWLKTINTRILLVGNGYECAAYNEYMIFPKEKEKEQK